MKKLITVIVILFCSDLILGQNVGIGTTTPLKKLHVVGDVRITLLPDSSAAYNVKADALGNLYRDSVQHSISPCGVGFLNVPNNNYSIEINEHPGSTWYDAVVTCRNIGARLCSWEQWYYACNLGLPLSNIQINLEWTSDHTGPLSVLVLGDLNCTGMATENPWNIRGFRCCCDK